jgi:hypothetical protein
MKYTILINQKRIAENGLIGSTDLVDWAIIDYISRFHLAPDAVRFDDHVWINIKTLMNEMPLLGLSSKQAVSRRLKKLRDLNLISTRYGADHRMYAKITSKCYRCVESDSVNSELTGCQFWVNGGVNPKVNIHQTTNNQTSINNSSSDSKRKKLNNNKNGIIHKKINISEIPESVSSDAAMEFIDHRFLIKKPLTQNAFDRAMRSAVIAGERLSISPDTAITETIDSGWAGINPDWLQKKIIGAKNETRQRTDNRSRAKRVSDKLDEIAREAHEQEMGVGVV